MKKIFIAFLICLSMTAFSLDQKTHASNLTVISIPKSGSHLLFKAIHLISGLKPGWVGVELIDKYPYIPGITYPCKHFNQPLIELEKDLKNKSLKKILLVRDLRDITVSQTLNTASCEINNWLNSKEESLLSSRSFSDKMMYYISQNPNRSTSLIKMNKQVKLYNSLVNRYLRKNVLLVRFENLIGPQGGGSQVAQKKEIKKIADFIGVDLSSSQVEKIANQLYGTTEILFGIKENDQNSLEQAIFFKTSQIGCWKTFFNIHVHDKFNSELEKINKELGYF